MNKKNITRRLSAGIFAIICLSVCLCITTFALVFTTVKVENNHFQTGGVGINLNNGKAVIEANEFLFEPGMTVEKDFFVENTSSDAVYYKVYFNNVSGGLAEVLEVKITAGDRVIANGTIAQLSEKTSFADDDDLSLNEKRELKIYFHFPEDSGNSAQDGFLSFDLCAKAVQSKNNPAKLFD